MNDIPPKQAPDASSGNLVAMYQAAGSNTESFPVLKAFQDYIDAERAQARKRVMILSISFSAVLCAVVISFLGMGIYLLKDMSSVNAKLIDAALAQRNAPVPAPTPVPVQQPQQAPIVIQAPTPATPPSAPANDTALQAVSKELADLRAELDKKKIEEERQAALAAQKKADEQLAELQKLQKEIGSIKKENQMLKESFVMSRKQPQPDKPVVKTPPPVPAVTPPPPPAPEKKDPAPEAPAVAAVEPEKTTPPEKPAVTEPGIPPATKEPPVTPPGVKAEEPKKGTMATAIPLKTKNVGTVPWRVVIPE